MFNTYEEMQALVKQGLAKVSTNGNLDTFKYAKKVMFDNLWDEYPQLYECRGHTYDNRTGELVVAAPRKCFNYGENNWGSEIQPDTKVSVFKKYNGFLACVSVYEGRSLISTTGSTKSDFVKMAEDVLHKGVPYGYREDSEWTLYYEIIHDNDPHIVDEGSQNAIYLGKRDKLTGEFYPSATSFVNEMTFEEAQEIAYDSKNEGFMIYKVGDYSKAIKLKTPYYVGKRKLMRATAKKVQEMYRNPQEYAKMLPEMWKDVPALICSGYDQELWIERTDQERRKILEHWDFKKGIKMQHQEKGASRKFYTSDL